MKFSELVSYIKFYNSNHSDLLIILPSFKEYDLVVKHLDLLSKQSYQEFDVILVLGKGFDDLRMQEYVRKSGFKFGVIIAKENERRGCSGGFFTGQKYALERNYKYAIMADDDCMPVDPELIKNLYSNRSKGYVSCTVDFIVDKNYKKIMIGSGPSQYSLFDRKIFNQYGLYYLPLFHGADDGEYAERLKGVPRHIISNKVEHPFSLGGMFSIKNIDRAMLFLNASLIIMKDLKVTLYNLALFCLYFTVYTHFFPRYGQKLAMKMLTQLITYSYGKKAYDSMKSGFQDAIFNKHPMEFENYIVIDDSNSAYVSDTGKNKLSDILKDNLAIFRKDVLVVNSFSFLKIILMAITAKNLYVRTDDLRYLKLAENNNLFIHILDLIWFLVCLPIYTVDIFLIFLIVKAIKQPKTMGYGL